MRRLVRIVFDCRLKIPLASVDMSKFKDGRVHFWNSGGWKGEVHFKNNTLKLNSCNYAVVNSFFWLPVLSIYFLSAWLRQNMFQGAFCCGLSVFVSPFQDGSSATVSQCMLSRSKTVLLLFLFVHFVVQRRFSFVLPFRCVDVVVQRRFWYLLLLFLYSAIQNVYRLWGFNVHVVVPRGWFGIVISLCLFPRSEMVLSCVQKGTVIANVLSWIPIPKDEHQQEQGSIQGKTVASSFHIWTQPSCWRLWLIRRSQTILILLFLYVYFVVPQWLCCCAFTIHFVDAWTYLPFFLWCLEMEWLYGSGKLYFFFRYM